MTSTRSFVIANLTGVAAVYVVAIATGLAAYGATRLLSLGHLPSLVVSMAAICVGAIAGAYGVIMASVHDPPADDDVDEAETEVAPDE